MSRGSIKYNIDITIEGENVSQYWDIIDTILADYPGNWEIYTDEESDDDYGIIEISGECLGTYVYYEGSRYERNGDPGYPDEYTEELDYDYESLEYELKKALPDCSVLVKSDEGSEW